MRTALLDGDIIAYRCGFASEKKIYTLEAEDHDGKVTKHRFEGKTAMNNWLKEHGEELASYSWESELVVEPLSYCLSTVKHMIHNIKKATKSDSCIIFLSGTTNFRDELATIAKYKGNRDKLRKPLYHADIVKYLNDHHDARSEGGLEADDLLADTQLAMNAVGRDTCIASIDKDLLQIEGKHYNFVTDKFVLVTPETARRNLYEQMLKGDRTDNIPGIAGVGDATAKKLLADSKTEEDMRDVVYEAWEDYLTSDNPPEWMDAYDDESKTIYYRDWEGNKRDMLIDDLLSELERLLRVGVPQGGQEDD